MTRSLVSFALLCFSTLFAQAPAPSLAQTNQSAAEAALSKNPKSPDRYNDLALALVDRARETSDPKFYRQAETAVAESLRLSPENFTAERLQVTVLLGKGQYPEALKLAKSLNKRLPDDVPLYVLVAEAAIEVGDYSLAEDRTQWALNIRPASALSLTPAARLRVLFGETNGAFEFFNEALRMTAPRDNAARAAILVDIARLSLTTGRLEDADKVLQQALVSQPDFHPALATLAHLRAAQQRYDESIDLWRRECQTLPQLQNYYGLAEALDLAGRRQEAAIAFITFEQKARASLSSPDNDNRELALYYADHAHKPAEAIRVAQTEIARRRDVYTLDAYAWALYSNGDYAEARKQMDLALAVGIRDSDMLYHAGAICLELHDQAAATGYWQQAISVNPLAELSRKALAQAGSLAQGSRK